MESFIKVSELIDKYAAKGVLNRKLARKAYKGIIDGYANAITHFSILCLCFMKPEEIIRDTWGNTDIEAWKNITQNAKRKATNTPEGLILAQAIKQDFFGDRHLITPLCEFRDAVYERHWKKQFTARGGFVYAKEINEAFTDKGITLRPDQFLTIYPMTVKLLKMSPTVEPEDINKAVDTFIAQHGLDDDSASEEKIKRIDALMKARQNRKEVEENE